MMTMVERRRIISMMRMKKMVMLIPETPSRLKLEVASYDHDGEEEKMKRMIMMMMTMLTVIMRITLMITSFAKRICDNLCEIYGPTNSKYINNDFTPGSTYPLQKQTLRGCMRRS